MSNDLSSRLERIECLIGSAPEVIGGKTELQRRLEDRQLVDIYRKHGFAAYRVERLRLNAERRIAMQGGQ